MARPLFAGLGGQWRGSRMAGTSCAERTDKMGKDSAADPVISDTHSGGTHGIQRPAQATLACRDWEGDQGANPRSVEAPIDQDSIDAVAAAAPRFVDASNLQRNVRWGR